MAGHLWASGVEVICYQVAWFLDNGDDVEV